jgi:cytidylate kinase
VVRAERRARQQGLHGQDLIERVSEDLVARDHADRHNTRRADDAVEIDSGDAGVDAVVDRIVELLPR